MTSKTVSADLLWKVIIWVEWNYAELSPEQKTERPQRAYHPGDGKTISPIITAVRKAYHAAKLEHGKKANFDTCKKAVLEEFTRKNGCPRHPPGVDD